MKVFEASNIKGNRDKFSGNVIVKSLKEDEIVPVEEIKSVFDFEFNNKTKKMSIFDYGENYKYWLTKKEIEDMHFLSWPTKFFFRYVLVDDLQHLS